VISLYTISNILGEEYPPNPILPLGRGFYFGAFYVGGVMNSVKMEYTYV